MDSIQRAPRGGLSSLLSPAAQPAAQPTPPPADDPAPAAPVAAAPQPAARRLAAAPAADGALASKVVSVRVPEVTELRLKALTAAADPTKGLSKNQVAEAVLLLGLAQLEQYLADPAGLGSQVVAAIDQHRRPASASEAAHRTAK
jgi:hypothetical protein